MKLGKMIFLPQQKLIFWNFRILSLKQEISFTE